MLDDEYFVWLEKLKRQAEVADDTHLLEYSQEAMLLVNVAKQRLNLRHIPQWIVSLANNENPDKIRKEIANGQPS